MVQRTLPSHLYYDVHTSASTFCDYRLYAPGAIPNTRKAQILEVRGWLTNVQLSKIYLADDPPDYGYYLELDIDWLQATYGIETAHKLMRVGSILYSPLIGDRHRAMSFPIIKIEIMSWRPQQTRPDGRGRKSVEEPDNWTYEEPPGCRWAWNPSYPSNEWDTLNKRLIATARPLAEGDYVRISGSMVTDNAHGREWAEDGTCAGDPKRWTEIHPPDLIERISPAPDRNKRQVAIALYASNGWFSGDYASIDAPINAPPTKPDPLATLHWRELIDGEMTNYRRIKEGNNGNNFGNTGARIEMRPDSIVVHVGVEGQAQKGAPGKFKAFYQLWWEPGPPQIRAWVEPSVIVAGIPTSVVVRAEDWYTHQPVIGQVSIGGVIVGSTNSNFNYTFDKMITGRVVAAGHVSALVNFHVKLRSLNVQAEPETVVSGQLTEMIVYAYDTDTGSEVTGQVRWGNSIIGNTNTRFTYRFEDLEPLRNELPIAREADLDEGSLQYWEHGTTGDFLHLSLMPRGTGDGGVNDGDVDDGDIDDGGPVFHPHRPRMSVTAATYESEIVPLQFTI